MMLYLPMDAGAELNKVFCAFLKVAQNYLEAELPPKCDRVGVDNFIRAKLQLTIDALDGFQTLDPNRSVESEFVASLFKMLANQGVDGDEAATGEGGRCACRKCRFPAGSGSSWWIRAANKPVCSFVSTNHVFEQKNSFEQ